MTKSRSCLFQNYGEQENMQKNIKVVITSCLQNLTSTCNPLLPSSF